MSVFHAGIERERIKNILKSGECHIHFIGIGGVGVYSLARLLAHRGVRVTGSDAREGDLVRDLKSRGVSVGVPSFETAVLSADLVVYTLAVSENNTELLLVRRLGIPSISRAELLGILMLDYSVRIGVSGSHGKSTVTAMLDAIWQSAGHKNTTVIGASLSDLGLPLRIGDGETLIYEACEYRDSFLSFSPTAAAYTGTDLDHTDYFKNRDALLSSYRKSIDGCPLSILSAEDDGLMKIARACKSSVITYGEKFADVSGEIKPRPRGRYSLKIRHASGVMPEFMLKIPARHNAKNALGAAAVALSLGISEEVIALALSNFCGIGRRLQYLGLVDTSPVYYDYAHHPTEIVSSISALREAEGLPVTVIFRPHTYSRTRAFLDEFSASLSNADRVILLEVDPVREISGKISSHSIAERIGERATVSTEADAPDLALSSCRSTVVLMGAGEVSAVLSALQKRITSDAQKTPLE